MIKKLFYHERNRSVELQKMMPGTSPKKYLRSKLKFGTYQIQNPYVPNSNLVRRDFQAPRNAFHFTRIFRIFARMKITQAANVCERETVTFPKNRSAFRAIALILQSTCRAHVHKQI